MLNFLLNSTSSPAQVLQEKEDTRLIVSFWKGKPSFDLDQIYEQRCTLTPFSVEFYFFTVNLYQSYVPTSPAKLQISFNTGVPKEGKIWELHVFIMPNSWQQKRVPEVLLKRIWVKWSYVWKLLTQEYIIKSNVNIK